MIFTVQLNENNTCLRRIDIAIRLTHVICLCDQQKKTVTVVLKITIKGQMLMSFVFFSPTL